MPGQVGRRTNKAPLHRTRTLSPAAPRPCALRRCPPPALPCLTRAPPRSLCQQSAPSGRRLARVS
eukprot:12657991-Alexandrium_andersonii.AAC.1